MAVTKTWDFVNLKKNPGGLVISTESKQSVKVDNQHNTDKYKQAGILTLSLLVYFPTKFRKLVLDGGGK